MAKYMAIIQNLNDKGLEQLLTDYDYRINEIIFPHQDAHDLWKKHDTNAFRVISICICDWSELE